MNKIILNKISIYCLAAFVIVLSSCDKDEDPIETPIVVAGQSFTQSFDSKAAALTQGWVFKNLSDDADESWIVTDETGNGETPFDGANLLYDSYLASAGTTGNISDWIISPKRIFQNGDKISFYTLSHGSVGYGANGSYGDRLQLRLNIFNTSDSIGEASTDVGHFTKPLIDINPLYKVAGPGDYPSTWTKYEATISGLNKPDSGRFAIRYFVEINGGANGDELAIDKVEFKSATP